MKYEISSIVIALIGISFVIWFNLEVAELFQNEIMELNYKSEMNLTIFTTGKLNKLIALGIALIGILLGIKSVRNKNRIGIIGIILSIFLIILVFIPIWQYVLSDSALDINFRN